MPCWQPNAGVAAAVVTATDKAVTELSDAELTSLVELSRDRLLT